MIAKLKGLLDSVGEDWAIIDVGGVGYKVSCSARTLASLPAIGRPVSLHIETQFREDAIRLFGFLEEEERDWFGTCCAACRASGPGWRLLCCRRSFGGRDIAGRLRPGQQAADPRERRRRQARRAHRQRAEGQGRGPSNGATVTALRSARSRRGRRRMRFPRSSIWDTVRPRPIVPSPPSPRSSAPKPMLRR